MYLSVLMCAMATGLNAASFEHQITVIPINDQYLVQMEVTKTIDGEESFLIAAPQMICMAGETSKIEIGNEDQSNHLVISISIPENPNEAKTSIYLKEDNEVVFKKEQTITIKKSLY